ncbi:MAG TPA: hypothetical protein VMV46_04595 [Thermoanaerobaculia bacterium]|nr:hypothetical protein [Thermoanaerobaculia bacterium]
MASGQARALRWARGAWGLAALGAAAALGALWLAEQRSVLDVERLGRAPAELEERAREVIAVTTGWSAAAHSARGFEYHQDYLAYLDLIPDLEERRRVRAAGPGPLLFWYRQGVRPLAVSSALGFDAPPVVEEGEIAVRLDAAGRLVEMRRWPRAAEPRQTEEAWAPVFAAAELDPAGFRELYARFVPPVPADARFTWTGESARFPGEEITVDGGTVEGRPTYFRWDGVWRSRVAPPVHDLSTLPRGAFALLALVAGGLAFHHRRAGLDDRRANRRLGWTAAAVAALLLVDAPLRFVRAADPASTIALGGRALAFGGLVWVGALALVPRLAAWPGMVEAWNRWWRGARGLRPEDRGPVQASAVLVGGAAGALLALISGVAWALPVWLGRTTIETAPPVAALAGGWSSLQALLWAHARGLMWTGMFAIALVLLRAVLRVRPLAVAGTVAVVAAFHLPGSRVGWIVVAIYAALWVAVLVRWGLLSAWVATTVDQLFALPLTTTLDHWAAATTLTVLAFLLLLLGGSAWQASRARSVTAPDAQPPDAALAR